jgi:hypothetical protein
MEINSKKRLTVLVSYFALSFVLHLVWENLQAPLYVGLGTIVQHFPICLFATATGDMIFMAIIYLAVAAVHRDLWWPLQKKSYSHIGTWIIAILVGSLLAISFELWAIFVDFRWVYGAMPLLPIVKVGLTPVLQMILIPPLVIWLSKKILLR